MNCNSIAYFDPAETKIAFYVPESDEFLVYKTLDSVKTRLWKEPATSGRNVCLMLLKMLQSLTPTAQTATLTDMRNSSIVHQSAEQTLIFITVLEKVKDDIQLAMIERHPTQMFSWDRVSLYEYPQEKEAIKQIEKVNYSNMLKLITLISTAGVGITGASLLAYKVSGYLKSILTNADMSKSEEELYEFKNKSSHTRQNCVIFPYAKVNCKVNFGDIIINGRTVTIPLLEETTKWLVPILRRKSTTSTDPLIAYIIFSSLGKIQPFSVADTSGNDLQYKDLKVSDQLLQLQKTFLFPHEQPEHRQQQERQSSQLVTTPLTTSLIPLPPLTSSLVPSPPLTANLIPSPPAISLVPSPPAAKRSLSSVTKTEKQRKVQPTEQPQDFHQELRDAIKKRLVK